MPYNIKGTNLPITPELRDYVEKKLAHVNKFVAGDSTVHTDVELEFSPVRDGGKYRAEFNMAQGGELYRAEMWGSTMHEAIDIAIDQLTKELRRSKKKRLHVFRKSAAKIKDFIRGWGGQAE